jgi:hypothetical protein
MLSLELRVLGVGVEVGKENEKEKYTLQKV